MDKEITVELLKMFNTENALAIIAILALLLSCGALYILYISINKSQ